MLEQFAFAAFGTDAEYPAGVVVGEIPATIRKIGL